MSQPWPVVPNEMVTGKICLFGPTAALLINAIKKLAHDKNKLIEAQEAVPAIQGLKINHLGSRNPRLPRTEILIALAITARATEDACLCKN